MVDACREERKGEEVPGSRGYKRLQTRQGSCGGGRGGLCPVAMSGPVIRTTSSVGVGVGRGAAMSSPHRMPSLPVWSRALGCACSPQPSLPGGGGVPALARVLAGACVAASSQLLLCLPRKRPLQV